MIDPKVAGGGVAIVAIGGGTGYAIHSATTKETPKTQTIGEKITEEWLLNVEDNSNEREFKELAKKLKTHDSNPKLTVELTATKGKGETEAWNDLKAWCQKTYKAIYEEDSDLWKLANKFCKKPTIENKLKGIKLDSNISTDTENLWKKKSESAQTKSKNNDLKTRISQITEADPAKFNALKNWCQEQYSKAYDSKFTNENEHHTFFSEVKKWCVILIEDKLDATKKSQLEGNNKENEWKEQVKMLKTHTNSGTDNFDLPSELVEVKTANANDENKWQKLKDWCDSKYELPFETEDATFKSVKKFCQKKDS